jgi:rhodanese-related sulfurtransferase
MDDNPRGENDLAMFHRSIETRRAAILAGGIVLGAAAAAGCATSRRVVASLMANCREVQPGVANEIIRDNPHALLLDVRHQDEFSADLPHLQHGREIPLSELPRRFREIGSWKTDTVVIFSRDGTDAASACEFLARQGFRYVTHVEGGVAEWRRRRFGLFEEGAKS